MMLYKNTKGIVRSPGGGTDFFVEESNRTYINSIFVYTLPKFCTTNVYSSNKRTSLHISSASYIFFYQKADDMQEKLWQAQTTQIIKPFSLIHQPGQNLNCREFANGLGDLGSIPGRVIPKTLKMVLDTSLFNTHQYKVCITGKLEQSRERSRTPH